MAVPSNYAALITAIDAILTTYGLSLFQVFGGRSTQPSLRELISLRWKLFSMTTPANYATLIAEIDVVIESYGLSLQEVFGGRSTQPTLQELIDLRYELFEVDGGGGSSDPSQITSETAPTTRVGGAALQNGDRWYKPTTGEEGFWNGVLWLGKLQTWDLSTLASTTAPLFWRQALGLGSNIFVRGCKSSLWTNAAHSNINYWNINIFVDYTKSSASSGTELAGEIANTLDLPASSWRIRYREINQVIPSDVPFIVAAQKVGNPGGALVTGQTLYYHEIME